MMNFHSVKSLSDFMLLQVGHAVKGFVSEVRQLTNASSGRIWSAPYCKKRFVGDIRK